MTDEVFPRTVTDEGSLRGLPPGRGNPSPNAFPLRGKVARQGRDG